MAPHCHEGRLWMPIYANDYLHLNWRNQCQNACEGRLWSCKIITPQQRPVSRHFGKIYL